MALNYIWLSFFLLAFVIALFKLIFLQDLSVFPNLLNSTFSSAKTGFEISLYLTGVMSLWLGLMKIGEKGGMVKLLSKLIGPFFSRLFPEIPKDHPANGSIIMNFSANMLGLDNAATPLGLKAMKELQEINPNKEVASDAQITFMVLNASGLTLIPITIIADRAVLGSINPTSIFIPTLLATFFSTIVGLIYLSVKQKLRWDKVMISYLAGISLFISLVIYYFSSLSPDDLQQQSSVISSVSILSIIIGFLLLGLHKKLPLFETFVEGAKEGFETSIKIIPYLVAMLVGIGLFRTSGAVDYLTDGIAWCFVSLLNLNADFVQALPVAILKPLSGQGSRAMMMDIAKTQGVDSFAGNLASIFRGCSETTFYVLAVYFGSINVRKTRYALSGGLIADVAGAVSAIFIAYLFFG
jgi:spore maturation protein SpmA/spore maturation protein SpmB